MSGIWWHDRNSSKYTSRKSYLLGFLRHLTTEMVAEMAIHNDYTIEEIDVETVPEKLPPNLVNDIDAITLSAAERYFTEDAWTCVKNTISSAKGSIYPLISLPFRFPWKMLIHIGLSRDTYLTTTLVEYCNNLITIRVRQIK